MERVDPIYTSDPPAIFGSEVRFRRYDFKKMLQSVVELGGVDGGLVTSRS